MLTTGIASRKTQQQPDLGPRISKPNFNNRGESQLKPKEAL